MIHMTSHDTPCNNTMYMYAWFLRTVGFLQSSSFVLTWQTCVSVFVTTNSTLMFLMCVSRLSLCTGRGNRILRVLHYSTTVAICYSVFKNDSEWCHHDVMIQGTRYKYHHSITFKLKCTRSTGERLLDCKIQCSTCGLHLLRALVRTDENWSTCRQICSQEAESGCHGCLLLQPWIWFEFCKWMRIDWLVDKYVVKKQSPNATDVIARGTWNFEAMD